MKTWMNGIGRKNIIHYYVWTEDRLYLLHECKGHRILEDRLRRSISENPKNMRFKEDKQEKYGIR
jgi:hypothetical protein